MNKTHDLFLNGQLKITQPSDGYRAATDPVFLAASISAENGQSILDIGSGVGTTISRTQGSLATGIGS